VHSSLSAVLHSGAALLADSASALIVVEHVVRLLEDDPIFNAGRGAVLTHEGNVELDAAIMDGVSQRAGAVAAVSTTRNPVSLARAVMEHSPHVFLTGGGADDFSRQCGLDQADQRWFITAERRVQLDEMQHSGQKVDEDLKYGTVGAVALDVDGQVAAATSTGGITGKRWGRIGDSPLIGAGTYADGAAAVSATGNGEAFIRTAAAHEICARVRLRGDSPRTASGAVLAQVSRLGGRGGVIVVTTAGEFACEFTTQAMHRGIATPAGQSVSLYPAE
jgi:L-asparaginase / beta-aspartyl-peptidase